MLDNLVELIVFTPRGSFEADPDFGFEYWSHEFSNVNYREFNNGQIGLSASEVFNDITKKECQDSVRLSLATYAPQLKHVTISIELNTAGANNQQGRKMQSKYIVTVKVQGTIEDGLGTSCNYIKDVKFLIEPTVKRIKI